MTYASNHACCGPPCPMCSSPLPTPEYQPTDYSIAWTWVVPKRGRHEKLEDDE